MKKILARLLIAAGATLGFSYLMYALRLEEKTLKFIEPHFRKFTGQG